MTETADSASTGLLSSLTELRELVGADESEAAFATMRGGSARSLFLELQRLERSLDQYKSRTGMLTYVGLLGHFSAGKSSTINSLLAMGSGAGAVRATGLHPTDRAVTLITHVENGDNLVGMHRRGEVDVGTSLLDCPLLKDTVLVDTPGSGDPHVVEEMVRDFLPVCDHLVYVFSAAVPLDTTDLPILGKARRELPFIPMRFVITRADEFKRDYTAALSDDNFDEKAADQFVSEFISRIELAVPGFRAQPSDFVLIDNRSAFRLSQLAEFVTGDAMKAASMERLHTHKLQYFALHAERIRGHFRNQLEETLRAQESLLTTARDNHARFQKTVLMSNSRLTESWQQQRATLAQARTSLDADCSAAEHRSPLPQEMAALPKCEAAVRSIGEEIESAADTEANALKAMIESHWGASFASARSQLIEQVEQVYDPEAVPLRSPAIASLPEGQSIVDAIKPPAGLQQSLSQLPLRIAGELQALQNDLTKRHRGLSDSINADRLQAVPGQLVESSTGQLAELLDSFLESVQVYKSAVLSLNARELAERAGVTRAIDALEKIEIPAGKRDEWLLEITARIFPDHQSAADSAKSGFNQLTDELAANSAKFEGLSFATPDRAVFPEIDASTPAAELDRVLSTMAGRFQSECEQTFADVVSSKETALEQRKATLLETVSRLREDRKRLNRTFAITGAVIAAIVFVLACFVLPLLQPLTFFPVSIGIVWIVAGGYAGYQISGRFDKSRAAIDECCAEFREHAREMLLGKLRELPDPVISASESAGDIHRILSGHWRTARDRALSVEVERHAPAFVEFGQAYDRFDQLRSRFSQEGSQWLGRLDGYFSNIDRNLEELASVSACIKEDAILPSFNHFEKRSEELDCLLKAIDSVNFGLPPAEVFEHADSV